MSTVVFIVRLNCWNLAFLSAFDMPCKSSKRAFSSCDFGSTLGNSWGDGAEAFAGAETAAEGAVGTFGGAGALLAATGRKLNRFKAERSEPAEDWSEVGLLELGEPLDKSLKCTQQPKMFGTEVL